MKRHECPECQGEGGWPINDSRPVRTLHDYSHGESYRTNWEDCPKCRGSGEIEEESDDD